MTSELNVVEAKEVPSAFQLAYKKTKYEIDTAKPDTVVVSDQHRQAEVLDKYYLLEEPSSIAKLIDVHNALAKKEEELSQRVEALLEKREGIRAEVASFDAQLQALADGPVSADDLLSVEKEKNLARGGVEEKDDGGRRKSSAYVGERLASHEQLYAIKEPLELTDLFEPKDDTKKPNKVLVLGRAEIGMNP